MSSRTISVRFLFSFVVVVVLLGACAAPQTPLPEQPAKAPDQPPSRSDDLVNLPPVSMHPPERTLRDGLPGPQAPGPERLVGLDAGQIQKMFGNPDFKRRDPPAEIWQYRRDGCMLDFFLYQKEDSAGGYRVTHVEARGRSVTEISGTECLLEALAR